MSSKKIIISGFGGQGIMLAGRLLCYAGLKENKNVTFFPAYGAEMRGGTANCQVIISDAPIGSPVIYTPDILVSLNKPSYDKFSLTINKDGLILANTSLYQPEDNSLETVQVPANNIAEECGSVLASNMVMLGTLIAKTEIIGLSSLTETIPVLLKHKPKVWELNKAAVTAGYNFLD
jgi:2-oxoglutarate ferredoxin oxidoreductase subunit gamma